MHNGAFVSNGLKELLARQMLKLLTIIERDTVMPRPAIHPGEILSGELEEIGVSPTELSRQIKVPPNRITQIIKGQRNITGDTALRLGHWFSTSPQFWLNLQSAYDIRMAEKQAGKEIASLPTKRKILEKTA